MHNAPVAEMAFHRLRMTQCEANYNISESKQRRAEIMQRVFDTLQRPAAGRGSRKGHADQPTSQCKEADILIICLCRSLCHLCREVWHCTLADGIAYICFTHAPMGPQRMLCTWYHLGFLHYNTIQCKLGDWKPLPALGLWKIKHTATPALVVSDQIFIFCHVVL
jgi:hypothetical protein